MKHSIADSNRTQMFVTEWIDLLMSQRRQSRLTCSCNIETDFGCHIIKLEVAIKSSIYRSDSNGRENLRSK